MDTDSSTSQQLLDAIRARTNNPTIEWATEPTPLTGGFWAEMYRVRLSAEGLPPTGLGRDLVARIMPDAEVAARETLFQQHLGDVGYPTPTIRLSSEPTEELTRAWMLMDYAAGSPLLDGLSGFSAIFKLPRIAKALPDLLAVHAADLHRIDANPLLELLDVGADRDDVTTLLDRIDEQIDTIARPDLASMSNWIATKRPATSQVVVCHGDLHPFNILCSDTGSTVLDWSAARIADPAYDIAYTQILLTSPPLSAPAPLRPAIAAAGRSLSRRLARTYNRAADHVIDSCQLEWFSGLHTLRILTEVATWQARDELSDHAGHPFVAMAPKLTVDLQQQTGINLELVHLPE